MAADPRIRASDADRDRTAELLREHHAAGRLDMEEFSERLDQVYAAKTLGQLQEVLADLPAIDLYQLPDASPARRPRPGLPWPPGSGLTRMVAERGPAGVSAGWRAAWGTWLMVSLACFVVWIGAGHYSDPWFLFIAGPWGIVLASRWLSAGSRRHRDPMR